MHNPLQETAPAASDKLTKDSRIVIFGASGDLTKRKLVPALYRLFDQGLLPEDFSIVGVGRTSFSDAGFRRHLQEFLHKEMDEGRLATDFCERISYLSADPGKAEELAPLAAEGQQGRATLFYLATPPTLYGGPLRPHWPGLA